MAYKNIIVTKADGIGKLVINKPPVNVMDIETLEEMCTCLSAAKTDPDVRVQIIAGSGTKAFSAGVEIRDHLGDRAPIMVEVFDRLFKIMLDLDKPIIGVVNGIALGGGCEVALACDMVVASEKAQFGQPEIKLSVIPPVAAVFSPRLFGIKKGMEFVLSGDSIDAREAERLGLVNKVVPEADLEKVSMEFAQRFTAKSGIALLYGRRAVYRTLNLNLHEALGVANDLGALSFMTDDAKEGLTAFLEKRKPTWKHK
ncbi:MAG: enoyl-CoA hydratase/isomerase family protein [Chloroflexi bacterium]|nr:enoyl-CoA hydratase/isomerase family protein [Chloroflexota bacterium]